MSAGKMNGILKGRRQGSAMVLALMVGMLLIVLITATMALAIVDTETVNDYSRNRQSFQAADSGLEHGKMVLAASLQGWDLPAATTTDDVDSYAEDAETDLDANNQDVSLLVDTGENIDTLLPRQEDTLFGSLEAGDDDAGVPAVDYDVAFDVQPTQIEYPAAGDISYRHVFHYDYTITSTGSADIGGQDNKATRVESGSFETEVLRPSFATYGYFTNSMKNQYNQQLWFFDGETYDGKTHVNVAPPEGQAAFWGTATFNGPFTAVQDSYEDSVLGGGAAPVFNDTVEWGVDPIATPTNGWSQLRASVGDYANIENQSAPTNNEMRAILGLTQNGNAVPNGLYFAQGAGGNANGGSQLLGGLMIKGDANEIAFSRPSANIQRTTIKVGADTYVIDDNRSSKTSSVKKNSNTPVTFNKQFNGLIHVEGNVLSLKGDGSPTGADIESGHKITLSATGDVKIYDHITYETDPIANPSAKNILGIFSSGGNIWLGKTAPTDLKLHATIMATGTGKGVGAESLAINGGYDFNYANKGKWKLLGGLIENKDQTTGVFYNSGKITGYTWDFTYDDRFAGGAAPPYFPYVTKFTMGVNNLHSEQRGRKYY